MTEISYHPWEEFPARHTRDHLLDLVARYHPADILEVGSGANPTLTADDLSANGIRYVTNDASEAELAKAPAGFDTLLGDVADTGLAPAGSFDLVFSRMVNEHVADGEAYFRAIHRLLRPGGVTAHLFSTLWAAPFVANRVIPGRLSDRVLNYVAPRDLHGHAKFQAHYSWSRGPSRRSISRLEAVGFEVVEYRGYFGHRYYANRLRPLHAIEQRKAKLLVRHPVPQLTAYAALVARKRDQS